MTPVNFVHLIGDSTLDNVWWHLENTGSSGQPSFDAVSAKKKSIEGRLSQIFMRNTVVNHAYDGFTTTSVLKGDYPGRVFQSLDQVKKGFFRDDPKFNAYINEKKIPRDQIVKPLEILEQSINENPKVNHYVILSVGGNDFRENLTNPFKLLMNVFTVQKRYLEIVSKIQSMGNGNVKPILMFQYRTDAKRPRDPYKIYSILKVIGGLAAVTQILSFAAMSMIGIGWIRAGFERNKRLKIMALSLSLLFVSTRFVPLKNLKSFFLGRHVGVSTFGCLLEKLYQPMLQKAKKDQIPILDLSNTFNPFECLYTESIEPNEAGGQIIAKGISEIVKDYEKLKGRIVSFQEKKLKIEEILPNDWEVLYPKH